MLIYKCVISGDELASDSFPITEVDDIFLRVKTSYVKKSESKIDIGANPSAEGSVEDECDGTIGGGVVNDFIDTFELQETSFNKKSFIPYIKDYVKKIKEHLTVSNPERVEAFSSAANTQLSKIVKNLDDYDFYTGPSMDPEGMVVIMGYEDKGKESAPYALLFKDGLSMMKQ